MPTDRFRLSLVVLLSGVLLVVSMGATQGPVTERPDPQELVLEAVESKDTKAIEGVRTEVFQRADQFEMVTVEVTQQPPRRARIELIDAIESGTQSDITVINGSTRWEYFREQRRAVRIEKSRLQPGPQQSTANVRSLFEEYQFEYLGTETVENRTAHVVKMTPPKDRSVSLSLDIQAGNEEYQLMLQRAQKDSWYISQRTWWIGTETSYPIKQRVRWTDDDGNVIATTIQKYHSLTVGAQINRSAFGFDPPEGVSVVQPTLSTAERYDSPKPALEAAGFTAERPDIPGSFTFHEGIVTHTGNRSRVMLTYTGDHETLTVRLSEGSMRGGSTRIVKTGVGSIEGTVLSVDGRPSLSWQCGGRSHRVSGLQNVETLTQIAESIGCHSAGTATTDPGPTESSPRTTGPVSTPQP